MPKSERRFVPAAGHDWLLPFYDPLWKLIGGDGLREAMIERAVVKPGQRILDIGCGTGSLVSLAARLHPEASFVGLDPDPKALSRARDKLERSGASVQLDEGFSDELPYQDASFDQIWSSFMFHHLEGPVKAQTLREVGRVLASGGVLHLVDLGGSERRSDGVVARLLHGHLHDNFGDRIPELMIESGLLEPRALEERTTLFGRITHYAARAPS